MLTLGIKILMGLGASSNFAKRFSWLPLAVGAVLAAGLLYAIATAWLGEVVDTSKEAGKSEAKAEQLEELIKSVETANEVREELVRPSAVAECRLYNQCLQSARTPANCIGLLPERSEDQCGAGAE